MIAAAPLLLALLLQADAPAGAPPEMAAAFGSWANCLHGQLDEADAEAPARRVADAALAACQPLQDAFVAAHARWLDGSTLREREKREARRSMARSVQQLRGNVLRLVREMRRD